MANEATNDSIASSLHVNSTRVRDGDGFVGTVLYVGPVPSAKDPDEIYAGIAWDDASRGKHDGSVICRTTNRLVRLFSCEGGSFMRLKKIDLGTKLNRQLMQSKYVTQDAPLVAPDNVLPHSARTASGRGKPIQFLGELQIRTRQQLQDLDKISLRSLGISGVVADESLVDFVGLRDIDLAGNLLSQWTEVVKILVNFPLLEHLSLASNRLCDIPLDLVPRSSLVRIRTLNLNRCSLSSNTLPWIARYIPNVEELCVAHNDMSCLPQNSTICGFDRLRFLDFSDCRIGSWSEHLKWLGAVPNLEQLLLEDNPIEHLPNNDESRGGFSSLSLLQLSGTLISSWLELDGLAFFPSLVSLRFRNTPLSATMGAAESRALIIARLPNVENLNSSPVSSKERIEAERRYISFVAKELLIASSTEAASQTEAVINSHARFQELVSKHKDTMVNSDLALSHGSVAQHVVSVKVMSMASASCNLPPLHKRLPGGLKVGRVKAMCFRAFGLNPELQILHFRVENDPFPSPLEDDDRSLSYYGVGDGAEILMNEIDLDARKKELARVAEEHDRRVVEQQDEVQALQELQRTAVGRERSAAIELATEYPRA